MTIRVVLEVACGFWDCAASPIMANVGTHRYGTYLVFPIALFGETINEVFRGCDRAFVFSLCGKESHSAISFRDVLSATQESGMLLCIAREIAD